MADEEKEDCARELVDGMIEDLKARGFCMECGCKPCRCDAKME